MIESDKYSNRSKLIAIKYEAIKHLKENGTVELQYFPSKLTIADILTKPEPKPEFQENSRLKITRQSLLGAKLGNVERNTAK